MSALQPPDWYLDLAIEIMRDKSRVIKPLNDKRKIDELVAFIISESIWLIDLARHGSSAAIQSLKGSLTEQTGVSFRLLGQQAHKKAIKKAFDHERFSENELTLLHTKYGEVDLRALIKNEIN